MILFLSNADSEILALRSVIEDLPPSFPKLRAINPTLLENIPDLDGINLVLVRLLGGRNAWEKPLDELVQRCNLEDKTLLIFGGESFPDAELAAMSNVASSIWAQAFEYLVQGGPQNIQSMLRFIVDTIWMEGFGFDPPITIDSSGVFSSRFIDPQAPTIAVIFYRAHLIAGNTTFISDLQDEIANLGANSISLYCYSLRPSENSGAQEVIDLLKDSQIDCVITTVLAAGGFQEDEWFETSLSQLNVPIVQGIVSMGSQQSWKDSSSGLSPIDVGMSVAIPEFDGRIISNAFSFKEVVDDGDELGSCITAYRTNLDRTSRVAGLAYRLAKLGHIRPKDKKIAIVLSAYPTKRSRIGNAVGLDTFASAIELLKKMSDEGYDINWIPQTSDELALRLADELTYESSSLTQKQLDSAPGRLDFSDYLQIFENLSPELKKLMEFDWGQAPGEIHYDQGQLIFSGLDLGGVFLAIQPPRGFGENPIAIYHSPELEPTHHYLGFYRWLDQIWKADAIIHLGKHGTLEWLPGKSLALSNSCATDACLGSVPLIYPFVVNDPGEGTQAKRRAHAIVIDHLPPPMTRADTYGDLAKLEFLLDEYAKFSSLDPTKLPSIQAELLQVIEKAQIHKDLSIELSKLKSLEVSNSDVLEQSSQEDFDDFILEVDGYLCELKDAQIRGGLHIFGQVPKGEILIDFVLSVTRIAQGEVPSLRVGVGQELGIDPFQNSIKDIDKIEKHCRELIQELERNNWKYQGSNPTLNWICSKLIPNLEQSVDEIGNTLAALDGKYIPPGPSGAPTRGMAHVLPTGRNFYSLDPKSIPSPFAYEVGKKLADSVVQRYLTEEGTYPKSVGIVLWGTAAMRTAGDDIAQALALMGVRPLWDETSARVVGLEVIPLEQLNRPRVDIVLRISGFFRDAFPHAINLLDEAVEIVANLEEDEKDNFIKSNGADDPRIFGSKPGNYGSGILALLESKNWRDDQDLAAVYQTWSGYSYGRKGMGMPAFESMKNRFASIEIAVKNQDNREHDIFDSDDYLQDHGGMIATIRSLSGSQPKAYFGDSSNPNIPKLRSLEQEVSRVIRSRVLNPKWIDSMKNHGYKGAFEMAATVDYVFGYDATAQVVQDWMYEEITQSYVADPQIRKFFEQSNPWALRSITEKLLEASQRKMWDASQESLQILQSALLEAEGWEESR